MRVHTQRKLVQNVDTAEQELEKIGQAALAGAEGLGIALIPDEQGLWLTIVQKTDLPLANVPLLPGFELVASELPESGRQDIIR
jgi:hypothetical protein